MMARWYPRPNFVTPQRVPMKEDYQNQLKKYRKRKDRAALRHNLVVLEAVPRRCDGCTACCTVMGVPELSKPYYKSCKHECEAGCSIYDQRPNSCQAFVCAWRGGIDLVLETDKPDKIGIVVDVGRISVPDAPQINTAWHAYEVWPGAADSPAALALFERLSPQCPTLVFRYGEPDKYTVYGLGEQVHTRKIRN